jgi:hypothetical protein
VVLLGILLFQVVGKNPPLSKAPSQKVAKCTLKEKVGVFVSFQAKVDSIAQAGIWYEDYNKKVEDYVIRKGLRGSILDKKFGVSKINPSDEYFSIGGMVYYEMRNDEKIPAFMNYLESLGVKLGSINRYKEKDCPKNQQKIMVM